MQQISKIAETVARAITDQSLSTTPIQTGGLQTELPEQAKEYINKVFERITVITPAWKNSIEGDAGVWIRRYKSELVSALRDSGAKTGEQIKAGLSELRKTGSPFLPSPGKFAEYCMGNSGDRLSHNTAAYRCNWKDKEEGIPLRQLVHKRSAADVERGLSCISELRKGALLKKPSKTPNRT